MQNRQHNSDRAELEAHLVERVNTYLDSGLSEEEATRLAQEKFGDIDLYLRQLWYQRHIATPLKAMRLALYWSLRGSLDICFFSIPACWVLSYFISDPALYITLIGSPPLLCMCDIGYRLDDRYPRHKHWGVLGVTLFWIVTYLTAALLFPLKDKPGNLHAFWLLIPLFLGPAYVRIPWRKNAKPTL